MGDTETFYIQGEKYNDQTTVGLWLRSLLLDLDYHETMVRLLCRCEAGCRGAGGYWVAWLSNCMFTLCSCRAFRSQS
jgi:hypothetical protein